MTPGRWTPQQVQAAARDRLSGLLSAHPDGTLSAHPLVRQTFRPLALGAAEIAADASLIEVPARIAGREHGLRVVEAIELLLDADQWQAAFDLYRNRTGNGEMWKWLPAPGLGQRAASAFVASPARRQACADSLGQDTKIWYLNEVGLFAIYAGDLVSARDYLEACAQHLRDADSPFSLGTVMLNLTECHWALGNVEAAQQAAAEAATLSAAIDIPAQIVYAAATQGWVAMLTGDTEAAEEYFLAADRREYANDHAHDHLRSRQGTWWGNS